MIEENDQKDVNSYEGENEGIYRDKVSEDSEVMETPSGHEQQPLNSETFPEVLLDIPKDENRTSIDSKKDDYISSPQEINSSIKYRSPYTPDSVVVHPPKDDIAYPSSMLPLKNKNSISRSSLIYESDHLQLPSHWDEGDNSLWKSYFSIFIYHFTIIIIIISRVECPSTSFFFPRSF